MRTETLLNNADASATIVSTVYVVDCGQDMRWLLTVSSSGLDGTPKLFVEESPDGLVWIPLNNYDCDGVFDYFPLDDNLVTVRDSYFMGKAFRVRIEPEDNTTGSIDATLIVKTKSV